MLGSSVRRDPRIDFFRGLALFMIFFDHLDNDPIGWLTYRRFGFSDAAEVFIFLSGVSCGIVYPRILNRKGWEGVFAAVLRRSAHIYFACLTTSLATIFLVSSVDSLGEGRHVGIPFPDVLQSLLLGNAPPLASILILYILLTLFVVPVFLAIARVHVLGALICSSALWMFGFRHLELTTSFSMGLPFSMAAWQFLFCIGIVVGMKYYADENCWSLASNKFLVGGAWTIVAVSFAYKIGHHIHEIDWLPSSDDMKLRLHPLRLLHFLSVCYLVATYIKEKSVFFETTGAGVFCYAGRHSLPIFCAMAVLTEVLNALLRLHPLSQADRLLVDGCILAVFGLACLRGEKTSRTTVQFDLAASRRMREIMSRRNVS